MTERPTDRLLDKFTKIVGQANTISDPSDMAAYLKEWRDKYVGKAALVLKPGSTDEVSRILKLANSTRTGIVPQGGNTGLVGAQIPWETGHEIILSLSRMNAVHTIDTRGNTLIAEAGAILQNVQDAADNVDRLFPLSLSSEGSCQIGGCLAANAGGIAVLAYGNTRNLVLGIEAVLADGRIWNGLRSLRKDNTGYDLKDLIIGSEGTLAIITRAVLKLFPKPKNKTTAFAGIESLEKVAQFFTLLNGSTGYSLTAFELLPRIGIEFAIRHGENTRDPLASPHNWYVLFEISQINEIGNQREVIEKLLANTLEVGLADDAVIAESISQSQQIWRLRDVMSEVQKPEGGSIKHDVSVPVAAIPDFILEANRLVEKMIPGCRPIPFGHFGDGNIHYNVSQPPDMDKGKFLDQWDRLSRAVYELVVSYGGSISAEHGIGRMKRDLLPTVKDPVEMQLMRQIKKTLDPNGILNPGKML